MTTKYRSQLGDKAERAAKQQLVGAWAIWAYVREHKDSLNSEEHTETILRCVEATMEPLHEEIRQLKATIKQITSSRVALVRENKKLRDDLAALRQSS